MTYNFTFKAISPYLPEKYSILQVTEVGSQMWGMSEISSDHDLVVIYQASTRDILSGRKIEHTLPCNHHIIIDGSEYDFCYLEIGHFCHLLKKGNLNMVFALLSPITIFRSSHMKMLYDLIKDIHTADIILSGIGLAESQVADMVKRAEVKSPEKSVKTAYRTINFVINHLISGKWNFQPIKEDVSEEMVRNKIDEVKTLTLHKEYAHMPISDIENWLCKLRIDFL